MKCRHGADQLTAAWIKLLTASAHKMLCMHLLNGNSTLCTNATLRYLHRAMPSVEHLTSHTLTVHRAATFCTRLQPTAKACFCTSNLQQSLRMICACAHSRTLLHAAVPFCTHLKLFAKANGSSVCNCTGVLLMDGKDVDVEENAVGALAVEVVRQAPH